MILVAADDEAAAAARSLAPFADVEVQDFGDIWLRDTGPILLGDRSARDFDFNGWGGKYDLPGDDSVGLRLAKARGLDVAYCNWVLEGGAIDGDGTGTVVTTEQCLLNRNRNPGLYRSDIEARLRDDLGPDPCGVARRRAAQRSYRRPCRQSRALRRRRSGRDSGGRGERPQLASLSACEATMRRPRGWTVVSIPSPGRVLRDEEIVPASYMNFYIGNARSGGAPVRRRQRRCSSGSGAGAVPRPQGGGPARRFDPDRRRQLPLHLAADSRLKPRPIARGAGEAAFTPAPDALHAGA